MVKEDSNGLCLLPLSRVKTIMKSSPDVSNISLEALFLTGKATELFVQTLALMSLKASSNPHDVRYTDLAAIINTDEVLQFLQDIIPRKVKAGDLTGKLRAVVTDEEAGENL